MALYRATYYLQIKMKNTKLFTLNLRNILAIVYDGKLGQSNMII